MALIALAALLIGILLVWRGRGARREHGLGDAATLDLDSRVLYSAELGLAGRPDRLFRDGAFVIPEEWKSSRRVYDSHRAQLGVYLLLVEEAYGLRPPYGVIVTSDGLRHQVANSDQLRAWVLDVAERVRAARRQLGVEIRVNQPAAKCRACGMKEACGQRR